jgi:predicted DCC family thiol-disulfide oxidoreductase YuxK
MRRPYKGRRFAYIGSMKTQTPDVIPPALVQTDLIVFDGECVLCSGFFRFMTARDKGQFRFATAQSPVGQTLYGALDLSLTDFETNLVIVDGTVYQRLDAFCMAMKSLGWPWRALSVARVLPRFLKDPMYHLIARNRYRIFGRYDTCMIPTPDVRARFVDGGA